MSIVKMKRIKLVGLETEKDSLLQALLFLGCVEPKEIALDDDLAARAQTQETTLPTQRERFNRLGQAISILQKHAPEKKGLFAEKPLIDGGELFAEGIIESGTAVATEIGKKEDALNRLCAEANLLESEAIALDPWRNLDVPLNTRGTEHTAVLFGTIPQSVDADAICAKAAEAAPTVTCFAVGECKEFKTYMLLCHRAELSDLENALKTVDFTQVTFTETTTAKVALDQIQARQKELSVEIAGCKAEILALSPERDALKRGADRVSGEIAKEEAKEKLLSTGAIFAMEAWYEAPREEKLFASLAAFACAYETSEPTPEEYHEVPVKLKGNRLTEPLNMVTEMYGLPAYDGIDPNGLIMPFFTVFFGIMYADIGYGLILMLVAALALRKRLGRGLKRAMQLLLQVGVTTTIFGAVFGGFFGDIIPVFSDTFLAQRVYLRPLVIDPLQDPTMIMIAALALGAVQIMFGMCVKIYMAFRDGRPMDGILDVVPWWIVFAGIGLLATGNGAWLAIVGAVAVLLTQGRAAETLPKKLFAGLGKLYDITAYLSDVLSYIRLMALLLATGAIASVVNLLAGMAGASGGVIGFILFLVVFLIGHAFNMGLNIIGTYVHSARLQLLEFFGKFYKEGGRKFAPLSIETKYHDIEN